MQGKVDLYNSAYGNYQMEVYRDVCVETYGEDLGQTSWVTKEEAATIPGLLRVTAGSKVLELGCGAGGYALRVAEKLGCHVTGLDVNPNAIKTAGELCSRKALDARVRFEQCDISKRLAFDDATFDAAFANDVMCHIPGRENVLREIFRVLKPGSRFLFSDALVIGGIVSHEEIATRSSIGYYLFSPPGENERLLQGAGFRLEAVTDSTSDAAGVAKRRHDARQKREQALIAAEGKEGFEGVQRFLQCVYTLTSEGRLRRYVYLAVKNA